MNNPLSFFLLLAKADAIMTRRLSCHGLTFADFMILYYLNEAPEGKMRRIDLAESIGLTASSITRMLIPMEKIGLISRDVNEQDARARYASLTPAGKNLLADATDTINNRIEDMITDQQKKNIPELTKTLSHIIH